MSNRKLHDQMMHIIHYEKDTPSGFTNKVPIPPELIRELNNVEPKYNDDLTLILEQYIDGLRGLLDLMRVKSLFEVAVKALPNDTENLAGEIFYSNDKCGLITLSGRKRNELDSLYDRFCDLYRRNAYSSTDDINVEYCKEHMQRVREIIKAHVTKIKTTP
ncbi:hypothetical protein [Pasteurella sp. PK-2025]|uniref:hypothetical protein n=1 Tax=unclassified Pasteurella TaxID=2621516 RepID=UPI003C774C7B